MNWSGQATDCCPSPGLNGPNHVPTSAPGGFRYALTRRYRITQCTRVSDVTRLMISMQYLGARPASRADARAWRRDGSPDHWRRGHGVLSAHPGPVEEFQDVKHGTGDFGGKNDLWLPANPAKLRTVFLADPQPGAKGRNNVIVAGALTVMNGDSVRPAVRAAAFRVLAGVPGVRMRPGVTDPEGQTGTAVWQDSWIGAYLRYETTYDIIDPQTGNMLGAETVAQTPVAGAAPGTVLFYRRNNERALDQPASPACALTRGDLPVRPAMTLQGTPKLAGPRNRPRH